MRRTAKTRLRRLARSIAIRALVWLIVPALLVLVLRAIWTWQSDHRLHALREQLQARGIRVYPSDFPDGAALPRDQNAVFDLVDAWNLAPPLTQPQWTLLENVGRLRGPGASLAPAEIAEFERIFAAYKPPIDALDAAESRPLKVWPRASLAEYPAPLYQYFPSNSRASAEIRMNSLLSNMAEIAYHENNDAEALLHIRRLLLIASILLESPREDVHTYSLGCRDNELRLLESILPAMDLRTPAVSDQARAILRMLRDDAQAHEAPAYSQEGLITRTFELNLGSYWEREWWIFSPMLTASHARAAELFAAHIPEFSASNASRANAARPPNPPYPITVADQRMYGWIVWYLPKEDYDRRANLETTRLWESVTHRRAIALLLAAQLYTAREGHPPENPAALVSTYLPAVPLDPFSRSNQPLHLRNDPSGQTVWSVGEDGDDEVGRNKPYSTGDDPVYGAAGRESPLPR